jgi:hypothetical protein
MPEDLEIVYEVATGKPVYMHSVDAAEACTLGDYSRLPAAGHEPTDQEKAAALTASRGMLGTVHPELQTPEEREATRREANAAAEQAATIARAQAALLTGAAVPPAPPTPRPSSATTARTAHASADDAAKK